jgi:hypothetical protein
MELEVTPAFPALIGRLQIPDAGAMNRDLQTLILAEEAQYSRLGRSNIGGWHSRPDSLVRCDPAVAALITWLNWGLRGMIEASTGSNRFQGALSVFAWATLCRAGAYHAPHSHPDSTWSGVYYVDPGSPSPEEPLSDVLEFLAPRAGVDAMTAPGNPYGEPFRVRPQAGLLVRFPSWPYHWVTGQTPSIAVSINAVPATGIQAVTPALGPIVTSVAGGESRLDTRRPDAFPLQLAEEETRHVDYSRIP